MIRDDIVTGIVAGLVSGGIIAAVAFAATASFEERQSESQARLENLRFVREVALGSSDVMPFRGLDLVGANLSGLRLGCRDKERVEGCKSAADFQGALLQGANLSEMDLEGANLSTADLRNADLRDTDLSGAILLGSLLGGAQFSGACWSGTTVWPDDFSPGGDGDSGSGPVCNPGL